MAIPRAPRGVRWLVAQTLTWAIVSAVFASVIGFVSAGSLAAQGHRQLALLAASATFGVLIATFIQQVVGLTAARKKESTHELEGCLYTLRAVLAPPPGCKLRLAIHVPVAGDKLEQITEYVGDSPKLGRIGRRFPTNAGIIGKAYREREVFVGRRINDDYESYIQELINDWNYTEEQARYLNPATMEWMAVPFYDRDRQTVEAVLYLDATTRGFFSDDVQELVLAAAAGIAVFIGKRYT
jgi:hypothetical protein